MRNRTIFDVALVTRHPSMKSFFYINWDGVKFPTIEAGYLTNEHTFCFNPAEKHGREGMSRFYGNETN